MDKPCAGAFDAALWIVRHVRGSLGLSLQESFIWMIAATTLIDKRVRASEHVRIKHMPDQFSDDGLVAELAKAMRRTIFEMVQALPDGFELRVFQDEAEVEWFDLESGKTICIDDVIAGRPD